MGSKSMPLDRPGAAQAQQPDAPAQRQATLGLISLLVLAAVVLFAIWLAQVQFARDFAIYDVELKGQVQGLSNGGAVYINGVRTGEVTRLALDPRDPTKVVARIRVSADTPVRQDSTAALEWLGVSGSRIIQLSGGTLSKPLLRQVASGSKIPVISGAAVAFDSNNPEGKSAAAQALDALDALNQRLSDENLATIGESLANARAGAATWRGNAKDLAALDAQLRQANQITEQLAQSAQSANGKVNGDVRRQLQQLADASANAKASIRSARAQIAQAQTSTEAGLQTLPAVASRITQVQGMVERAGEVVDRFDAPQPQILGAPASQTLKVAP